MRLASSAAHSRSLAAIFPIAEPVIRDTGPDTEIAAGRHLGVGQLGQQRLAAAARCPPTRSDTPAQARLPVAKKRPSAQQNHTTTGPGC
jgi:hypothetical protein